MREVEVGPTLQADSGGTAPRRRPETARGAISARLARQCAWLAAPSGHTPSKALENTRGLQGSDLSELCGVVR